MSLIGRGRVFAPFWSENWYRFCPFWSFSKDLRKYLGARNDGRARGRHADASPSRALFSLAPTTSKRLLRSYGCATQATVVYQRVRRFNSK